MMPKATTSSASAPLSYSSLPTCGPTKSTRFNSCPGVVAVSAAITRLLVSAALLSPLLGRRIRTSWLVPKVWTDTSVSPAFSSTDRMAGRSAGWLVRTSITVPPVKSTPRFRPLSHSAQIAKRKVSSEIAVVTFPHLMKGMFFLNGKNSSMALPLDGDFGQPRLAAIGEIDHGARHGDGAEHGSEDAQAQDDRKAAHRAGTQPEQGAGGDQLAERERDTSLAGQGQRGLQHRQQGDQE